MANEAFPALVDFTTVFARPHIIQLLCIGTDSSHETKTWILPTNFVERVELLLLLDLLSVKYSIPVIYESVPVLV